MEPATRSLNLSYVVVTEIEKVEQRYEDFDHGFDADHKPTSKSRSTGWWLVLRGFPDAIWFGDVPPFWDVNKSIPFAPGDKIKLTIQRITN